MADATCPQLSAKRQYGTDAESLICSELGLDSPGSLNLLAKVIILV